MEWVAALAALKATGFPCRGSSHLQGITAAYYLEEISRKTAKRLI
jgi:hypothetical protein